MSRVPVLLGLLVLSACAARGVPPLSPPTEPRDDEEALGQRVFAAQCHSCHPDGHAGLGPSVLTPPRFVVPLQVRLGFGAMPAFSRETLSREQLRAVRRWVGRLDRTELHEEEK